MAEFLDPHLLAAENDRMEQVLRLLEGFIHRPGRPVRVIPPSQRLEARPEEAEPAAVNPVEAPRE